MNRLIDISIQELYEKLNKSYTERELSYLWNSLKKEIIDNEFHIKWFDYGCTAGSIHGYELWKENKRIRYKIVWTT